MVVVPVAGLSSSVVVVLVLPVDGSTGCWAAGGEAGIVCIRI